MPNGHGSAQNQLTRSEKAGCMCASKVKILKIQTDDLWPLHTDADVHCSPVINGFVYDASRKTAPRPNAPFLYHKLCPCAPESSPDNSQNPIRNSNPGFDCWVTTVLMRMNCDISRRSGWVVFLAWCLDALRDVTYHSYGADNNSVPTYFLWLMHATSKLADLIQ